MRIATEIAYRYLFAIAGGISIPALIYATIGADLLERERAVIDIGKPMLFSVLVFVPVMETVFAYLLFWLTRKAVNRDNLALFVSFGALFAAHCAFSWIWAITIAPMAIASLHAFVGQRHALTSIAVASTVHFLFNLTGVFMRHSNLTQ